MVAFFVILLCGVTPYDLASEGALSPIVEWSSVQSDGSILLNNLTKVFHLSPKGEQIRVIGREGTGPGEFKRILSSIWDGRHYVFFDAHQRSISILNSKGQFLNRFNANIRMFQFVDNRYFLVDLRPFIDSEFKDNRALIEATLDNNLQLVERQRFYTIDARTYEFKFNYKLHFLCRLGDYIYVISQLNNILYRYSLDMKLVNQIQLSLPQYARSKKSWPEDNDRKKVLELLCSTSYITNLFPFEQAIAVAYTKPKPNTLLDIYIVQLVDTQGKNLGAPLLDLGTCIGSYQDKLYFLKESSGIKYQLLLWDRK